MNKHILIVEDEKDLLDTLEYNFKHAGYKVSTTTEGNKAISFATGKNNPDLIILDLMLPDVSGLDVCKKIKNNPVSEKTPILMLTAKGEEVDRILGFELGADDYLVKPFSLRELTLRVAALLKRNVPVESDENIKLGDLNIDLINETKEEDFTNRLNPVYKAISQTAKSDLLQNRDLIGFVGAPWTILVYMINKISPKNGLSEK